TGQKKYKTEIIVNDLSLLSGRSEGGESGSSGGYSKSNTASFDQRAPAEDFSQSTEITDDDIPF
ncbi:MAG: single stranded DNA-binding domain-containing protein, partial [Acidobacteriaceae bacterium]